jgi:hypothetical protein
MKEELDEFTKKELKKLECKAVAWDAFIVAIFWIIAVLLVIYL